MPESFRQLTSRNLVHDLVVFEVSLQQNHRFNSVASTVNDLLVFHDIDSSGEEGIAITRSIHLVNNNSSTLYDIGNLVEVDL